MTYDWVYHIRCSWLDLCNWIHDKPKIELDGAILTKRGCFLKVSSNVSGGTWWYHTESQLHFLGFSDVFFLKHTFCWCCLFPIGEFTVWGIYRDVFFPPRGASGLARSHKDLLRRYHPDKNPKHVQVNGLHGWAAEKACNIGLYVDSWWLINKY